MLTVKYVRHDIEDHPLEEVFAVESVTRLWNQAPSVKPSPSNIPEPQQFDNGIICTLIGGLTKEIYPTPTSCNRVYVMNNEGKTDANYYI